MAPATPDSDINPAIRACPARIDQVVVRHHHQRDADVDAAQVGQDPVGRGAPLQGPQRRLLDGGPVDHRVGEGDAHLDGVGPGTGQRLQR